MYTLFYLVEHIHLNKLRLTVNIHKQYNHSVKQSGDSFPIKETPSPVYA